MRNIKTKCALLGISIIITNARYISGMKPLKLGDKTRTLSKETEFLIQSKNLDEIYYTLEDKRDLNLSEEALCAIKDICDNEIREVYEYYNEEYINILDINELNATDAYANFEKIEEADHKNTIYYDEEKNSIDWEHVAHKIHLNGLNSPQNADLKSTESLSIKEIKERLKNMEYFLEKVKQDFPDYDVKELACKLEDYSFLKGKVKDKNNTVLAQTSQDSITYYINKELESNSKEIKTETDYHEDFHLFTNSCQDIIENEDISSLYGGIFVHSPFFPKYYNNEEADELAIIRYQYTFLEEIYAELYASETAKVSQSSYFYFDEILNIIQVALGLDEEYQIDSILKDLFYKDPIAFIRHFPVYGDDETNYFLNNLRMLKAFDILLLGPNRQSFYFDSIEKNGLKNKEAIMNFKLMSFSQLSKIFFHNLIIINERYKNEIEFQDNCYLIRLFEEMLYKASFAIDNIYEDHTNTMSSVENSSYELEKEDFIKYLSRKYNLAEQRLMDGYEASVCMNYINTDYELPEFFGEKKDYYNNLMKYLQNSTTSTPYNITLKKVK